MPNAECNATNEEAALTGMLAEFRDALRAEIEAARRNAVNTAVPLISGRLIARVGGRCQYAFKVESLLELPDDSPADLIVPGRERIEAMVVSVEGLNVVVSVANDLSHFIPSARLQTNLTLLLRKLIMRIEAKRDSTNAGADRLLSREPVSGQPKALSETYSLNPDQIEATASSLGRDTTFIWGPPGTGKTQTIGAIGAELYKTNRSCLVVSHTNIAVDQALLRISGFLPGKFSSGSILRVGEPRDDELRKPENKELLLATHVERRQAELTARKKALEAERESLIEESKRRYREIEVAVWAREGGSDIESIAAEVNDLREMDAHLQAIGKRVNELRRMHQEGMVRERHASELLGKMEDAKRTGEQQAAELEREKRALLARMREQTEGLVQARMLLESARRVAALREQLGRFPTKSALDAKLKEASGSKAQASQRLKGIVAELAEARNLLERAQSVGAIRRALSGLPNPEKQALEVERIEQQKEHGEHAYIAAAQAAEKTLQEIAKVENLTSQIAAFGNVPSVENAGETVAEGKGQLSQSEQRLNEIGASLRNLARHKNELQTEVDAFYREYGATPEGVAEASRRNEKELCELEAEHTESDGERLSGWSTIEKALRSHIEELARWELCDAQFGTVTEMLEQLKAAHFRACEKSAGVGLQNLEAAKRELDQRVIQIEAEVESINQLLAQVEEDLIAEATIVATTLTRTYLRESIQRRSFDTVILDEASMAPIPALWVAAGLSSRNVIAVGDFRQLPPIVQAEHHELAKKWRGRDIFDAAGVSQAWKRGQAPEHFVALKLQRRMHPQVSAISNHLVYRDKLEDDPWVKSSAREDELRRWYRHDWGHDAPVLLVDTGSAHAWVTSVARGGSVSRLNFLSATVCVDLAEQLLRSDRDRTGRKILIVSPYRPHARLVNLLLQHAGLRKKDTPEEDEVVAGTAHSFQGSEADVVILDLVVDEPHWRTNLFVPELSEQMRQLLNVALTRARRRLLIVGDFDWCAARGRQAFLGSELIPFLLAHYPRVEAIQIVPEGLAARAAKAHLGTLGGDVEPKEARLVVTQEHFYPLLFGDLGRVTRRVVVYSPFLTPARVEALRMHLRAAFDRAVKVYVVTKTHEERKRSEIQSCLRAETQLREVGVTVIHKKGMHEKLVFLDEGILWSGSLNPLSFSSTQEVMERRASSAVVEDYAKTLRLAELLAPFEGEPERCPICRSEMIASEGGDGEPFYWRCVTDGCYSRGVDDPSLQNGMIAFGCGRPLEFRWWDDDPIWICTCGRHHRQKVHPNHLRLPKMKALIGKQDMKRVEKLFNLRTQGRIPSDRSQQQQLFEL